MFKMANPFTAENPYDIYKTFTGERQMSPYVAVQLDPEANRLRAGPGAGSLPTPRFDEEPQPSFPDLSGLANKDEEPREQYSLLYDAQYTPSIGMNTPPILPNAPVFTGSPQSPEFVDYSFPSQQSLGIQVGGDSLGIKPPAYSITSMWGGL